MASTDDAADRDAPGRYRALLLLATSLVLAMSTWFSTAAILGSLREDWSLSSAEGAWLTIAVQLGFVTGALGSAALALADRVNPRRLILGGAVAAAAANALLVLVDGFALGVPLRFLTGAALAAVYPPALKAIASWFRRGRGVALGAMVGGLTLGSALPHLVNAVGGADWRTVILATSVLTLAGGLVADRLVADGPYPFPKGSFEPRQAGHVLRDRTVRLATLGYFGHMWELYAMWAWFGAFALAELTDRPRVASAITFAVIGVGALGALVGGRISDRRGRAFSARISMLASAVVAATIGFLPVPAWAIVLLGLVWGFWVIADSAQFSTLVTENADQRYVGTAVTLQLALGFVLSVLTIFLVPVLSDGPGWGVAFLLLAPGPLLGAWAMRRLERGVAVPA